jgi:hypothetical protein
VFRCVDEAHLIYKWGLDLRLAFLLIGAFFRGRLPTRTSVLALSATMQPGAHESFVLNALGFVQNTYTLIRRSNKRPNIQFSIQILSHGLGGSEFPSLLPYLNSRRKLAIHCKDINLVTRVFYCGQDMGSAMESSSIQWYLYVHWGFAGLAVLIAARNYAFEARVSYSFDAT